VNKLDPGVQKFQAPGPPDDQFFTVAPNIRRFLARNLISRPSNA
jgi:hypothetical protein